MSQVSINLGLTGSNDYKTNKAITDVNPNASDAKLYNFATLAGGLTTNNLAKVVRIEKYEIESGGTAYPLVLGLDVDGDITTMTDRVIEIPISSLHDEENLYDIQFTANNEYVASAAFVESFIIKYKLSSANKAFGLGFEGAFGQGEVRFEPFYPDLTGVGNNADLIGSEISVTIPDGSFTSGNTTIRYTGTTITFKVVADA